jgi:hypothetical protein
LNRNFARKEAELVDRMEFEKATVLVWVTQCQTFSETQPFSQ